jgi:hypothetical protein
VHAHACTDPVSVRLCACGPHECVCARGSSGHGHGRGGPVGMTRACMGIQRGTDMGVRGDPAGTDTGVWGSCEHDGVSVPRANERLVCKRD